MQPSAMVANTPAEDLPAAFVGACKTGDEVMVREMLALTGDRRVDVHAEEEDAFRWACWKGHVNVIHELLALTGDRTVDVHAKKEEAFREACQDGNLGVVRELLSLTGDRCPCSQPSCSLDSDQLRAVPAALAWGMTPAQWGAMGGEGGVLRHPHVQLQLREVAAVAYRGHRWGVRGGAVAHRAAARNRR